MALKTDYLDYQLDGDRSYQLTPDGGTAQTVKLEDISEYTQIGDTFGAADINATNKAVNDLSASLTLVGTTSEIFKPYATSEYSENNWAQVSLRRQGQFVFCYIKCEASLPAVSAETGFKEYTIPNGYKPKFPVEICYPCVSGSTVGGFGAWGFTTDGKMYVKANECVKQWYGRYASGCWLTTDDYPS